MKAQKKVKLTLVGLDGNAFSLMGAFGKQARRDGWSKDEIDVVITKCMAGSYDELLCTLMDVCDEGDGEEEEFEMEEVDGE